MRVIFCADPLHPSRPDEAYLREVAAAETAGLRRGLISFEALVYEHDAERAVRRVAASDDGELGIYRGWMLRPEDYVRLYDALEQRGLRLINTPDEYTHCHHLPASYSVIEAVTPRTVWLPAGGGFAVSRVMAALRSFGDRSLLVKDYVKSQKHLWSEACYITSASDTEGVMRVVNRFLELQGDDLAGGLVFREFVALEPLARHSKSAMPLSKEFRRFILDSEPLLTAEYWEEGLYGDMYPPDDLFSGVACAVRSRYFTMDIAQTLAGEWVLIELGDGQVAGLPERTDVSAFYRALAERVGGLAP